MRIKVMGICLAILFAGIVSVAQEKYPTVDYKKADEHIGEIVWIEGTVLRTETKDEGTYLCFHNNKKYVRVLVPNQDLGNFEGSLKHRYVGKTIKAIGRVDKYQSQLIVGVNEPKRIRVVENET